MIGRDKLYNQNRCKEGGSVLTLPRVQDHTYHGYIWCKSSANEGIEIDRICDRRYNYMMAGH